MISYIKGSLEYIGENYIVIECGGIGYRLTISTQFINRLPDRHAQMKAYTYMYVREDEVSLYGFYSEDELEIFRVLISLSGVGPKVAMSLLSTLTVKELRLAVISEDVKSISKANGIGTKGASRIILELKDKLKMEDMIDSAYDAGTASVVSGNGDARSAVVSALTALGYSGLEAGRAVSKVKDAELLDEEQLLKAALKNIL